MIAKIFGVSKIRINSDGPGITTLIGMYKCPLNCEYCINNPITKYKKYTIEDLFQEVYPHALYYEATGGGICFGGHEPLLQQDFIINFIKYVKDKNLTWNFGIETSLNHNINQELLTLINYAIIDIKDINNDIYKKYTEINNTKVLENLKIIKKYDNLDIKIRLPLIPNYNNFYNIEESKKYLLKLGYNEEQFDIFTYET